jgi:rSAM/selenodomain-associated transferase 1
VLPRLLLFARAPVAGQVKTRLAPLLTAEGAARLYHAFLEDAARTCSSPGAWDPVLEVEGDPDDPDLARIFGAPWQRTRQPSGDLGKRLTAAFRRAFAQGAPAALAVGSDHPELPRRRLLDAFAGLSRGQGAVLVPADDGGYCAIGLAASTPVEAVFRDIPWSSGGVLAATFDRLEGAGVAPAVLEGSHDVDRPEDLIRLRRDLASRDPSAMDYPRATALVLEALT